MKTLIAILAPVLFVCIAVHSADDVHRGTVIVAQRAFRNQTGNIRLTTLFTPTVAGTYPISIDVDANYEPAGDIGPEPVAHWTDDFSDYQSQIVITGIETNGTTEESGQLIVHDVANKPIQLSATGNDNGQGRYNLYVVVEEL